MSVTTAELELIVERLLTEGVPPSVVGRVFHLDDMIVKEALSKLRVKRYGTDDLTEYAEQLQWDAVEHSREIIAHGSEADKTRITNAVLGKHIALSSRRTPEGQRRAQEGLLDELKRMRDGSGGARAEEEIGEFVVRGNVDA